MAFAVPRSYEAKRHRRLPPLSPVPELVDSLSDEDCQEPSMSTQKEKELVARSQASWTSARVVSPSACASSKALSFMGGGQPLACRVCHIPFTSMQQFAEHRKGLCQGFLPAKSAPADPEPRALPPIRVVPESTVSAGRKRALPPSSSGRNVKKVRKSAGQHQADLHLAQTLQQLLDLPSPLQILSSVCSAFGAGKSSESSQLPPATLPAQHGTEAAFLSLSPPSGPQLKVSEGVPPPLVSTDSLDSETVKQCSLSPTTSSCDLSLSPTPSTFSPRGPSSSPPPSQAVEQSSERVVKLLWKAHTMMRSLKAAMSLHRPGSHDQEIGELKQCIAQLVEALKEHLLLQKADTSEATSQSCGSDQSDTIGADLKLSL